MIEVDSVPSAAHAPLGAGLVNIAIGPVIQCAEAASLGMVRARIARIACACSAHFSGDGCPAMRRTRRGGAAQRQRRRSAAQRRVQHSARASTALQCCAARRGAAFRWGRAVVYSPVRKGDLRCALVEVLVPLALWHFGARRTLCASPRLTPYMYTPPYILLTINIPTSKHSTSKQRNRHKHNLPPTYSFSPLVRQSPSGLAALGNIQQTNTSSSQNPAALRACPICPSFAG